MTNRFLISTAIAALIAGTSFANAQGTAPAAGSTVQQTAPSSGGAASGAMNRDSGASGMKGAESTDTKAPDFCENQGIAIEREDAGQQERSGHPSGSG